MKKSPLTVERLRHLLDYDPATGIFVWKNPTSTSMKPGHRAGAVRNDVGYWRINIDGQKHLASTLAWMYMHGEKPARPLRHKNKDKTDCRLENLVFGEFHYVTPEGRRAYDRADRRKPSKADKYKNSDLKRYFGITLQDFQAMLIAQSGVCAICGEPETMIRRGKIQSLSVDHNHDTLAVRDLLCTSCNAMIGYSRERPDLLRAAAAYLERHAVPKAEPLPNIVSLERRRG